MEPTSREDLSRGRPVRPGTCRSYGAWLTLLTSLAINMELLTELSPSRSSTLREIENGAAHDRSMIKNKLFGVEQGPEDVIENLLGLLVVL
jgi:hypothetical protein